MSAQHRTGREPDYDLRIFLLVLALIAASIAIGWCASW